MVKTKTAALIGLVLAALAGPARAADADQVERAKKFLTVQSRAKGILFFMHPTAEYRGMTFAGQTGVVDGEQKELEGWFCLEYRFDWKSGLFGGRDWSYLKFFFDNTGKLHSIRPGKTSSVVPPFAAADIVLAAVKEKVIEAFEDDPEAQKVVRRFIRNSDAKGLLAFLLRAEQN